MKTATSQLYAANLLLIGQCPEDEFKQRSNIREIYVALEDVHDPVCSTESS